MYYIFLKNVNTILITN